MGGRSCGCGMAGGGEDGKEGGKEGGREGGPERGSTSNEYLQAGSMHTWGGHAPPGTLALVHSQDYRTVTWQAIERGP
ncbi:hypothetical protein HZH68_008522 [Vespula germanica]|uniref:Uncharacterized protein n=2 Tax=Vespula TaxID=7451 RepID=A0A834K010_VESGE|nr:hypothetical protein HZH68_008522 [Vespula germanica]KAF7421732.1 hypothetical protein H0235_009568 [Vespula pensylvanica]